ERTTRPQTKVPRQSSARDTPPGPRVEMLNPHQHIATLAKDAELDVELVIRMGRGYVPAERNKREEDPAGSIPLDAIFSPITKVNFMVTNARVGQRTDYDRLVLEVFTDGSVRPEDAVAFAARIFQQQLSIFVHFEDPPSVADGVHAREVEGEGRGCRLMRSHTPAAPRRNPPRCAKSPAPPALTLALPGGNNPEAR